MAAPGEQLPAGWTAEWNQEHQRYLFIDTASGHTQWEPPAPSVDAAPASAPAPARKGRQYAAGQTNAYYGDANAGYGDAGGGYGAQAPGPAGYAAPDAGATPGGQIFTPGLASEPQFGGPQNTYFGGAPAAGYQGAPAPGYQGAAAGYPGTPGAGYPGTPATGYPAGPGAAPAPGYGAGSVDQLAGQFGGMGFGPGMGQKPPGLQTANLLTQPPDPVELLQPPPESRLPAGACISNSPHIADGAMYQRCTMNAIPTSSSLLGKTKMPLALVINPYPSVREGEAEIPVITDQIIARCRRCRLYINPFVQFIDGGNRWRCPVCSMANDVPQMFDWDAVNNQPGDRWSRPELNHTVVDFVAGTEYMVRAPPPYTLVFLIEVTHTAVQTGLVATAVRTIQENLDRIPNHEQRTQVAIIAYDTSLHFFAVSPEEGGEPSMLVVSDVDDVFLPKPSGLLINLDTSRAQITNLLERLPAMFAENHSVGSALGPALQAAQKLLTVPGGRVIAVSASLPSLGAGALKNREDNKILGTSKESSLLQPASGFYKSFAIDCSRSQVSIDLLLCGSAYQDVATLACLPRYTSGQTYYYPSFNAARPEDAHKFAREFEDLLAMPVMVEAVMRPRASRGMRSTSYHGNFFVMKTDLLAMPAVPQNQSYVVELEIEETLTVPYVVFQTAVMHTTCYGERRIRVITTAMPTTQNISEVFASADQLALVALFANKAVERSLSHKMEDARDAVFGKTAEILSAYRSSITAGGASASAQLAIADNLHMFPVLMLGLLKTVGLRQSAQIPSDLRAHAQALLTSLPIDLLIPYLYPTFYSLHAMPEEAGTVGEHGVIMPRPLPLTLEKLERHGLFLIEDGQNLFLWVGRDAVPQLVLDVFGVPAYADLRGGKMQLPTLDNPFSQRVTAVVQKARERRRSLYYQHLFVVKEDGDPALRAWAMSGLIQDRSDPIPGYQQFIQQLREKVNA